MGRGTRHSGRTSRWGRGYFRALARQLTSQADLKGPDRPIRIKGVGSARAGIYERQDTRGGCHHGHAVLHLLLESGGHRPERSGLLGVLRGRHRRNGHRQVRALVHPRHHAVLLRGARRVHRELQHVRARRRLPRGARGHGRDAGQVLGFGADVRLRADRADQRRQRRPVSGRADQRDRRVHWPPRLARSPALLCGGLRGRCARSISGARTSSASTSPARRRCASCRSPR